MAIERLAPGDELVLWPDDIWPQDIGAIVILDGEPLLDADGGFRLDAVRAAIAARLHLVPRFRQLVYSPAPGLGGRLWVDSRDFDICQHVKVRPLPAPGDEAQLLLAVQELRGHRLDRARPLWEMWFLPGLSGKRVGLFVRLHHVIADGIAGVATIGVFLDPSADAETVVARPWKPAPPPSEAELRADQVRRHREARARFLATLRKPLPALRALTAAWPAMRELLGGKPLPPTSLDRVIGKERTLALVRGRLDTVRAVAHANGATVNDVLLAATAGGLRELLSHRGEAVDGLVMRAYVPVSLRLAERATARGNMISDMAVPIPVGEPDPRARLRQIAADTRRRKAEPRPALGKMPQRGLAGRLLIKLFARQRVNVVTADIPGPEVPLYLAGARLLEVFPVVNLLGNQTLGVGAMSYAGAFNTCVFADSDSVPDVEVFAAGFERSMQALEAAVGGEPRTTVSPAVSAA